jgi:hypothetical protein
MHPLVRPGIDIHSYTTTKLAYTTTKLELPAAGPPANNRAVISKARVFDWTLTMLSWAEHGKVASVVTRLPLKQNPYLVG